MRRGVILAALALCAAAAPRGARAQDVDLSGVGYVLGDSAARVAVVEFSDFACGACALFWRTTWPHARRELVETGRVVWRQVPFLLGFPRGEDAARAAECAGAQGAFFGMHDRLFEGHEGWKAMRRPRSVFREYAAELGLDLAVFDTCYDKNEGRDRTRAATRAARASGVRGTPTFLINGRPAVGALTWDAFLALIEEAERAAASGGGGVTSRRP